MHDAAGEQWKPIMAALLDDDARAVLAETAPVALTVKRRERALQRLERCGLVRRAPEGIEFAPEVVRQLLASSPRPTGPERFLDRDGRIDRYPANHRERTVLLEWIAQRAVSPGEVLSEAEIGDALEPFAPAGDVAVLRRYLVDGGILRRTPSGSEYVLADAGR